MGTATPFEGPVEGVVAEWDDPRGVGLVRTDDGRELDLQCTDLADGSRTIAAGTRVRATVAPGHHGRWKAVAVEVTGGRAGVVRSGASPRPTRGTGSRR